MINIKYKLEFFNINKQSLKRKISNDSPKKLINLLKKRGTSYFLFEIKYIIKTIYLNITTNENISLIKKKKYKEKYLHILEMIDILENDNLLERLKQDIVYIYNRSINEYISTDELNKIFIEIAEKYSVTIKYIENEFILLNKKYIKNKLML